MKKVSYLIAFAVFACVAGVQAGTYTWSGGSGDFTDWGVTTVTGEDAIQFYSAGVYTPWIDGREGVGVATNFLCKSLSIRNNAGTSPSELTLEVRNGGLFEAATVGFSSLRADPTDSISRLRLTGGSVARVTTVDVGGYKAGDVNGAVEVLDGSKMTVSGETKICASFSYGRAFTLCGSLCLADSDYVSGGKLYLGNSYEDVNLLSTYRLSLAATNSTLTIGNDLLSYHGQLSFKDSDLVFTGSSSDSGGNWQSGALLKLARGSSATFDGGMISNAVLTVGVDSQYGSTGYAEASFKNGRYDLRALAVGVAIANGTTAGDEGLVTIGEGATVTYPMDAASFTVGFNAGSGTVHVAGGTLSVRPGATQIARIAARKNALYGCVKVTGGLWDHAQDVTSNVEVGSSGEGHVYVSGGEVKLPGMNLSTAGAVPSSFEQSGGTVKIRAKSSTAWNDYLYASGASVVKLTGGSLSAKKVFGSTGSSFIADGGTLKPESGLTDDLLYGFTTATCGTKGLAVDTDGMSVSMSQALTDASGVAGLFRKTGNGTLTVSATSFDVANTVVDGGTLKLGVGSFATALVVTNGAAFSLAGDVTGATLSALTVANGTLKLDPTDVLTVTGPVSFDNLKLELTSLPAKDEPCNLLVVTGELSAEAQDAWRHAVSGNLVADGEHVSFTFDYDAGSGKTTMTATVKDDVPLADTTTWTGAGGWGTAGNWSDGVPTLETVATFAGTPQSREVAIAGAATAGALSFAGGNYTLSGGVLTIDGEKGAARIDVAADSTNVINSAVKTYTTMIADVAGAVTLGGDVTGGGIEKTGSGRLTLGAASAFTQPVTQKRGILEVAAADALGTQTEVRHSAGVVKFAAEDTLDGPYRQLPAASTDIMTLNASEDVTLADWRPEGGRVVKRGAGTTTVKFKEGAAPVFYTGGAASANSYVFPDDGTTPYYVKNGVTNYFPNLGGLTVLEGRLLLTSDTPGLNVTTTGGKVFVGIASSSGEAEAWLTVKDINVTFGNDPLLELGQMNYRGCFCTQPTFELINSTTYFNTICVGDWCYGQDAHPTVILTNSWLSGGYQVKLSQANGYGNAKTEAERAYVYWRARDSKVSASVNCAGFTWFGGLKLDFDNSIMSRKDDVCDKLTGMGQYSYGYMNFTNGSLFAINSISALGLTHDCLFRFAGSTWKTDDDLTLSSANVTPQYFKVESSGEGLRVAAASDKTFTFKDVALSGDGGIRSTGAGTVAFASGMYKATGKILAEAGVIDFADAGTIEGAVIGAGAGVIKGATFKDATIALESVGGAVPTFENCAFTGRTKVVIAGDPEKAEGALIANFTGSLTGVGTFRLKGWKGYGGTFAAKDGKVTADIDERGMMMLVR